MDNKRQIDILRPVKHRVTGLATSPDKSPAATRSDAPKPRYLKNPFQRQRERLSKQKSTRPKSSKQRFGWIIAAVIVLAGLALAGYYWWQNMNLPVKITDVEIVRAISSRVKDAPVQTKFKAQEPIMVNFTFNKAEIGVVVKYFVINDADGNTVRSGELPALRADSKNVDAGERHISIVSSANTALPAGKYSIELRADDRLLQKATFEVE
jgi:hypothetical protein